MTANKTYIHKLTGEKLTAVKNDSQPCPVNPSEQNSGVLFINENQAERFLTNHQIQRLLK